MRVSAVPFRDEAGEITGAVSVVQDIDTQKRAEEALQKSEERFRTVFTQAAAGLAIYTPYVGYQEVNDRFCEITGYNREELLSKGTFMLVHPEDQEELAAATRSLLNGETSFFVRNIRSIRADGRVIWIHVNISFLHNYEKGSNGQPKLVCVVEDITERKKAEGVITEEHKSLEELVYRFLINSILDCDSTRHFIPFFHFISPRK
jgi:PAS domain S-box-containing protein